MGRDKLTLHSEATVPSSGSPSDFSIQEFWHLCYLLSSEARAKIIFALAKEDIAVCELSTLVSLSPSAVSQHLKLLRDASAVETRRENQKIYYRLATGKLEVLLSRLGPIAA
ncbi:ArsR/SmtB family transcription factor [Brucella pseudintermedia]|uniref:ArsR/SmtB family transcription factor n=1 Tax=Brucella pseudintermedia TaxID=370111 RepID=UPI00367139D4